MTDNTLSEALKEAYASAPSETVLLHTLELRHPAFVDDNGNPTAIRIVRDNKNYICRLEDTAPLNPGEEVEFQALPLTLNCHLLKLYQYRRLLCPSITFQQKSSNTWIELLKRRI